MFSPRVRSCPLNISWTAQPFSFFYIPNLIWWCVIMRQCVMRKNWFTIFNVKVTARTYIIKLWLFFLYFLNCCSICKQTWYGSRATRNQSVLWKNVITALKVKVTAKVQNVSESLSGWYFLCVSDTVIVFTRYSLNRSTIKKVFVLPNLVWWFITMR